jgi:HD-like signal output (HDOD) protein
MSESFDRWIASGAWLATNGQNLPLMSTLMRDALALGVDPDVTPQALIKRISSEQQLAARVLQLANLAANAPMRAVTSIDEAVVRLGTRAVQRALMSACMESWSQPNAYGAEGKALMPHALGTAYIAALVAEAAETDPDEAFAYGLLHDVGKLFLLKLRTDFRKRTGTPPSQEEFEGTLSARHAEVGEMAMHRWGLPIALREPIRFHHTPLEAPTYGNEAAVAYVANRLSHRYGFGCPATPDEPLTEDTICASTCVTDRWLAEIDKKAESLLETVHKGLH